MRDKDAEFFRLKAATVDLIDRCGGQARAGKLVGVVQQQMSRVCTRDDAAMLRPVQKLALEQECGEPVVTRVEAEILGYRLERDGPRPTTAPDGTPFDAHAAVLAEVADLALCFSHSVRDGVYSSADSVMVGRALADLRREIERFERVNAATQAGALA